MNDMRNKPLALKLEKEWQKGFLLGLFENCTNPFRREEINFCYAHFRSLKEFTFYEDEYGGEKKPRPVYFFEEIFGQRGENKDLKKWQAKN